MHYRKKSGVMDLPVKQIIVFFIKMLEKQQEWYDEAATSDRSTRHTEKQKLASHPFLLRDELEMEGVSGLFFGKTKYAIFSLQNFVKHNTNCAMNT